MSVVVLHVAFMSSVGARLCVSARFSYYLLVQRLGAGPGVCPEPAAELALYVATDL